MISKYRKFSIISSSAFFCLSYSPLFVIMVGKSLIFNYQYLYFGGLTLSGFKVFFRCFSIPTLCLIGIAWGALGSFFLIQNLENRRSGRIGIEIKAAENQGSEALTYLISYALPLLQSSGNAWMDSLVFLVIISLYFGLYRATKLILVNPILNLFYNLYQISFVRTDQLNNSKVNQGWAISALPEIAEGDKVMALDVGNNLFYITD